MRLLKLGQFVLILCCLVSLSAPAIAACTCSHPETSTPCHSEHSSSRETSCEHRHRDGIAADSSVTIPTVISESECCCALSARRAFAKSENIKIEKQTVLQVQPSRIEINITPQVVLVKTIDFAQPLYLSDSFYNLSPGRAPPRL